ncbi:MAG: fibronectin type III domain-containing protein [Ignavibacteriales bacterium]|nr:fibronectin type III domain-containing protein [Ignavibacteriales bacterium]
MKRILLNFSLLFILFISSTAFGQIRNFKSMEGTWTGQWVNNYYGSTGNISVVITVDEVQQKAHGNWTVGGAILGVDNRPGFLTDITLTSTGFTANFNSIIWGDISGTGFYTGAYSGTAINIPNPNASNIAATGTFNNLNINGTFSFRWTPAGSNPISGTVQITKQNPVADPSNLIINENPAKTINLQWNDNSNNETGFRIDRKKTATGAWTEIAIVGANVTTYKDQSLDVETEYTYRVAAYSASTESEYTQEVKLKTLTSIDNVSIIPSDYLLLQNYPNPFNPSTLIRYDLPRQSQVKISIFTILGEHISTLVNDIQNEGHYELNFNGSNRSSGVYLVKMIAQSVESGRKFVEVKKMLLIK